MNDDWKKHFWQDTKKAALRGHFEFWAPFTGTVKGIAKEYRDILSEPPKDIKKGFISGFKEGSRLFWAPFTGAAKGIAKEYRDIEEKYKI